MVQREVEWKTVVYRPMENVYDMVW
jgi:hypothetical protein